MDDRRTSFRVCCVKRPKQALEAPAFLFTDELNLRRIRGLKDWCILLLCAAVSGLCAEFSPVQLANPLQGTDSHHGYSHGNEYPAVALPFPMNTWLTRVAGCLPGRARVIATA
jgi:hypothetical protein